MLAAQMRRQQQHPPTHDDVASLDMRAQELAAYPAQPPTIPSVSEPIPVQTPPARRAPGAVSADD